MPKRSEIEFDENTVKVNKPREKRYQIRDRLHKGLILRVMPTGTKTWMVEVDRNVIRKVGDANKINLSQARIKATQMQAQHSKGEAIKSSRSTCPTLENFIDGKYRKHVTANNKTGAADVSRLLSACKSLMSTRLDKLNEFQIEKWKADRLKNAAPATVHRDLATLRAALSLAVKWAIISRNPAGTGGSGVKVKVPRDKRVRYLSDDERTALLRALENRDKQKAKARHRFNKHRLARGQDPLPEITGYADYLHPLVLLVMNTGLRRGEALSLTWDKVRLEGTPQVTVTANYAKSSTTRHIPLNSEIVAILARWKKQTAGKGWVFPNPATGHRMQSLKTSWPALMKKAGIPDFRFHDLRHDFASRLVMAGVDLYRVRDLLGHHSISMTERYAHLAPKALAEAVEVLV
jgi:integrase